MGLRKHEAGCFLCFSMHSYVFMQDELLCMCKSLDTERFIAGVCSLVNESEGRVIR